MCLIFLCDILGIIRRLSKYAEQYSRKRILMVVFYSGHYAIYKVVRF